MKRKLLIFPSILITVILRLNAQELNYSQYYANVLQLNPAFAGAMAKAQINLTSRYQWPKLGFNFFTNSLSADYDISEYNSGVGIRLNNLYSSLGEYSQSGLSVLYAYHLQVNSVWNISMGVSAGIEKQSFSLNKLTFPSQFNDFGFLGGATLESFGNFKDTYPDVSGGLLIYSQRSWLGASVDYLNKPVADLQTAVHLSPKVDFHVGHKFHLNWYYIFPYKTDYNQTEISLSPTISYRTQGKSDQLNAGMYLVYGFINVGMWYQGLPLKVFPGERSNHDAVVLLLGLQFKKFKIGYSYDITISRISSYTGGSHELTLNLRFPRHKYATTGLKKARPECPEF